MHAPPALARPAPAETPARRSPGTASNPFSTLNDAQRAAVDHGPGAAPAAPLLVIAGAGSGKTLALASRVARLVRDGADPQRLLLLTFSRRAAAEMASRAGRLLHQALGYGATQRPPAVPWAGTFHGIGARLLRDYAGRIGLSDQFTVHDRGDSEDLMALVRQELGFAAQAKRFPLKGTCLAILSRAQNSQLPLDVVLKTQFPWCAAWEAELKTLFAAYTAEKQRQQVLDYDDLLLWWWQMLQHPPLAREIGARFDHLLVDEYQDTNRLQAAILLALKPDGRGLTVVGDDAQSIYSFRAAELRNILDFPRQFEPAATVLTLEQNYRSTPAILAASNAVIALAAERHAKQLWSAKPAGARPKLVALQGEAEQATWVADEVLRLREEGLPLKSQAVLFRTSHHSAAVELELTRRQIPYVKFGGLKFLEAAHVKDVLALLRWAQNPRSRMAGFRVAQLVPGLGPASARRLLDAMATAPDPLAALRAFKPPPAAAADWREFVATLERLYAADAAWPADFDTALTWYRPQLQRLHEDAAIRLIDLDHLSRLAAGYGSRERFLTELTLDPPEATSDESGPPHRDEDYLILSTIHSAKGQEWQAVYVLNVVDGCMPSDMATGSAADIEEERRLLYVAMTRAKHELQLLVPQRFYVTQQAAKGDRHMYGGLSRFITPAVAACFERVDGGRVALVVESPTAGCAEGVAAIDVAAQMRAIWR